MSTDQDEWVRVESEDELRPGMAVQLRPCVLCHRVETFFLGQFGGIRPTIGPDGSVDGGEPGFFTVGRCDIGPGTGIAPREGIRRGILYRLRDLPAEETTTVAAKRRVSA